MSVSLLEDTKRLIPTFGVRQFSTGNDGSFVQNLHGVDLPGRNIFHLQYFTEASSANKLESLEIINFDFVLCRLGIAGRRFRLDRGCTSFLFSCRSGSPIQDGNPFSHLFCIRCYKVIVSGVYSFWSNVSDVSLPVRCLQLETVLLLFVIDRSHFATLSQGHGPLLSTLTFGLVNIGQVTSRGECDYASVFLDGVIFESGIIQHEQPLLPAFYGTTFLDQPSLFAEGLLGLGLPLRVILVHLRLVFYLFLSLNEKTDKLREQCVFLVLCYASWKSQKENA